jgi:GntR family transcriptional regulator
MPLTTTAAEQDVMSPVRSAAEKNSATKGRSKEQAQRVRPATASALYDVVARSLKEEIISGVYSVGAQLPTEANLCKRFAVSRHTVRDALRILRDEGLVSSRQGAGTVVAPPASSDSFLLEATSINDLVAYAAGMYTEIQSTTTELIEGKMASKVGVASGQEWLVVRGLARSDGQQVPVCWSDYYIHRDYAAVGRLLPRHSGPLLLLIEDFYAVNVVEIEQEISTTVLTPALATSLKAKAGATAIEVKRTYRMADGKVAQISIHTHPAPRFRYVTKMRRVRA